MTSARPDTRLLVASPVTTDLSQWLTDLTASGSGAYEDPSVRTALDGTGDGRSLEAAFEASNASEGWILRHGGDVATQPYGLFVKTGEVRFMGTGATVIASIVMPGIGAGLSDYIAAINTEPNPLTTGAADALRSEFLVYDVLGKALAWLVVHHAVIVADPAGAFSVGGEWDGAVLQIPYPDGIDDVRVSSRFHTRVEVREHWVAPTTAPTPDGITAVEGPVLPAETTLAKSVAGPQYQAAAAAMAVGRNRHRMVSAAVQCIVPEPPMWEDDLADVIGAGRVYDLELGYQTPLCWLWRRRIPRHCSWVRVRVQWATWDTDGQPPDLVELRAHTADAPPPLAQEQQAKTISRNVDDGTGGIGVLETFELLYVERDLDGWTWLFLSARTDGGSGAGNVAYSIREISIVPVSTSEGFDDQPPNQWSP